ncbi:hypothetical protein VOLCADRAFT_108634 [Volvox carteri f. nagariensis]|uniref:BRX domain-containing protein n=1 Tax=Volvox carteri f. nagariensis TaxID=3068 RepID=D8ULG5_VOLCA|nr:uncharacterized protein VOLCADRAFT_108634 [Volvox carteri f. nagariensis]EFJ39433.1 hypothetical protein VOLCADRAFT_108634 [Volvox carteri f. nagariensis]|eukprot:XP_002959501.1 hypothetical protein VOLCADRAFT_108634 [Volvox carteri f. nagariensis]
MEPAVDESLNSAAGIDRLGSVILSVALPLAAQGSLHRQMYVSQQQRPPLTMTPTQPQQPQQQAPAAGCSPPNHIGHVPYEPQYSNEPSLSSIPSPTKDGLVRPTSETSYPSSTSGEGSGCLENAAGPASGPVPAFPAVQEANGSLAAAAASAGVGGGGGKGGARGGGGAGAPIWRRRNAFVEWANTMHHEMVVEEQPPGGSSASGGGGGGGSGNGSGSGVPGGGMPGHGNTVAGGAGGTEQHASSSSGYNVPLALAADTLPPEGVQFQYAPGVYITLKPPAQKGGPVRLVKVRFNRKMFTEQSQGQAWWNMHRATLAEMYELTFNMGTSASGREALAEFEEEALEEGYDEDDEEPEDDEDGDGGEMEPAVDESLNSAAGIDRLGSVILSVALPLAAQGSLHRQMYVSQQQRPPLTMTPTQPQQPQQQAPAAGCSPPNHIGHVPYEPQYSNEPSLSSIPSPTKDGLVRPTSETSYPSSTSGEGSGCLENAAGPASGPVPAFPAVQEANGSLAAAAASAGVGGGGGKGGARGGGGAGAPIWRRRNAFVEWANTMHHEMVVEEQPPGGSSASGGGGGGGSGNGSGSGVPGGGMPGHGNTVAGGAGGTEQHASSSSGYNVPLALAADTLPPEGVQFQYAPGVYITLKPPAQKGGPVRLVKVRFNRKMFTEQSQGQAWWNMHRATLAEMYELTFNMGNKCFWPRGRERPRG